MPVDKLTEEKIIKTYEECFKGGGKPDVAYVYGREQAVALQKAWGTLPDYWPELNGLKRIEKRVFHNASR